MKEIRFCPIYVSQNNISSLIRMPNIQFNYLLCHPNCNIWMLYFESHSLALFHAFSIYGHSWALLLAVESHTPHTHTNVLNVLILDDPKYCVDSCLWRHHRMSNKNVGHFLSCLNAFEVGCTCSIPLLKWIQRLENSQFYLKVHNMWF